VRTEGGEEFDCDQFQAQAVLAALALLGRRRRGPHHLARQAAHRLPPAHGLTAQPTARRLGYAPGGTGSRHPALSQHDPGGQGADGQHALVERRGHDELVEHGIPLAAGRARHRERVDLDLAVVAAIEELADHRTVDRHVDPPLPQEVVGIGVVQLRQRQVRPEG